MTEIGAALAPSSVRALLASASAALGSRLESRWIVGAAAGLSTSDLVADPDMVLAPEVSDAVRAMVDRRVAGEPLQHVLGSWAFRTLEVRVDRRVLIPRPETEQVVSVALDELRAQERRAEKRRAEADRGLGASRLVAVDLGTGSGVIALSLACEFASPAPFEVWATDLSADTLDVCRQNLDTLARRSPASAAAVRLAEGSWFGALPGALAGHINLVVANPPYVSRRDWEGLDPVVRDHEPRAALVPGPDGFEAIEVILAEAPRWLAPGGSLVVEMAPSQAATALDRATTLGYVDGGVRVDLAGRQRVLVARSPGW